MDIVIDIQLASNELEDFRAKQFETDTQDDDSTAEEIWSRIYRLIDEKTHLYRQIFAHSTLAPEDIQEYETQALEMYFGKDGSDDA